ncbi:MAG: aspartyl/asparaginyl beta-hydroxylase domain-containing protein [Hyphomicrobiales bacterium]
MSAGQTAVQTPKVTGFRKWRRRKIMKIGQALTRGIARFEGAQSLIGDPPVIDAGHFPFVNTLESNWQAIRDEVAEIMKYRAAIPLFEEISTDQKSISRTNTWRTFFLYGFGEPIKGSCKRAPITAKLLSQIPDLQNAFFSILEPGSHIPPHEGLTKGLLTCHLGLIIPKQREKCRIRVADRILQWEEGRMFIFDDTRTHEVWNDTDEIRVVLLFHVDRPMRPLVRMLHRTFVSLVKLSAYVKEPKARIGQFEDRFEAAVRQSHQMFENAGRH